MNIGKSLHITQAVKYSVGIFQKCLGLGQVSFLELKKRQILQRFTLRRARTNLLKYLPSLSEVRFGGVEVATIGGNLSQPTVALRCLFRQVMSFSDESSLSASHLGFVELALRKIEPSQATIGPCEPGGIVYLRLDRKFFVKFS